MSQKTAWSSPWRIPSQCYSIYTGTESGLEQPIRNLVKQNRQLNDGEDYMTVEEAYQTHKKHKETISAKGLFLVL